VRAARPVRREVRGNGPGAIPAPRPGLTQRNFKEALTHSADPLDLAAVFGIDDTTAIRYATIARQLLQTPSEQQDPTGSNEPKGPNHP
jgi:hypothetical protein